MTSFDDRLTEIQSKQDALNAERDTLKVDAIAQCLKLIELFGLTVADLKLGPAAPKSRRMPPKYRDPVTGKTWTGQGAKPKWFKAALAEGKSKEDLLIK